MIKATYYHGAKARIAVYNVSLSDENQSSSANIWVVGGPDESLNVLMAGWQVYIHFHNYIYTHFSFSF